MLSWTVKPGWRIRWVLVGALLGVSMTYCAIAADATVELEVARVEGGTLFFRGASPHAPLKTTLTDPKFLGVLKADGKGESYLLVTGKASCTNCPQDRAVYLYWPTGNRKEQFVYPGKIIDPKDGHVVFESRAFFGNCLSHSSGDSYVAFQKDWVEKKKHKRRVKTTESSVYVGTPTPDHLHEEIVDRRGPKIAEALQRVKSKQCSEIEARNRYISSVALTRKDSDDEVDDSDDEDARAEKTQIGNEVTEKTNPPSAKPIQATPAQIAPSPTPSPTPTPVKP